MKAAQKKLEREKAQKEKEEARKQTIDQKREAVKDALDKQLEEGGAQGLSEEAKKLMNDEKDKEEKLLEGAAPPPSPRVKKGPKVLPLEEAVVKKLFDLLDRSGKAQVSQRDVMVALRKHPPVRALFRLPVANADDGSESLESRLLAIQDAFESGSGLGELSTMFEELRAGNAAQNFSWPAFLECCQGGSMLKPAHAAAGLLPREHTTVVEFIATEKWTEVPEGAACPAGLEYKMDMSTGRTMARIAPKKPAK